jgi:hypothetical protein
MKSWIKTLLIVIGIFAAWLTVSILTYDDNMVFPYIHD